MIPSNDKSAIDNRCESFSQLNNEKSDSTEAVLANTVVMPPTKSLSMLNLPSTTAQAISNEALPCCSYKLSAALRSLSCR